MHDVMLVRGSCGVGKSVHDDDIGKENVIDVRLI